jgi:Delta carbonic anhydrase
MSKRYSVVVSILSVAVLAGANGAARADSCLGSMTDPTASCETAGPQSPRDIQRTAGSNPVRFAKDLLPITAMRLCDIHFHQPAEHKIPATIPAPGRPAGFVCAGAALSDARQAVEEEPAPAVCQGVQVGDTIEVHWVYTTCNVEPAPGLDSCFSESCKNPQIRAEAQVFRLTPPNYPTADNWAAQGYSQRPPLAVVPGTVEYLGSTTGDTYDDNKCSPVQVVFKVRPNCRLLTLASLNQWCANNPFNEDRAHGVRQLVELPRFLSSIP